MKANPGGRIRTIKTEGSNRFLDVPPQLFPIIGACKDAFGEALCDKTSIALLRK